MADLEEKRKKCKDWMSRADIAFQEIKRFKELLYKADEYPFNKPVFCEFEIIAYHNFTININSLIKATNCYYIDTIIPEISQITRDLFNHQYTYDGTRLIAKPEYKLYPNSTIYPIIERFLSQMPCEPPVSVWDKAKTEFEKLSKEEQGEYVLYITHPSAFWLHPKRWDDQDTTHLREGAIPIWKKELPPPESLSRKIMKKGKIVKKDNAWDTGYFR